MARPDDGELLDSPGARVRLRREGRLPRVVAIQHADNAHWVRAVLGGERGERLFEDILRLGVGLTRQLDEGPAPEAIEARRIVREVRARAAFEDGPVGLALVEQHAPGAQELEAGEGG